MIWRILAFGLILSVVVGMSSCSKYNKILKSQDVELKYQKAIEYYNKKDYQRALPLFEELIAVSRGTSRSEIIYYHYAYCYFGMRDFYLASFYFDTFTKTYPNSEYTEECAFMSAYCHYMNSPIPSLDQSDTKRAINQLQRFLERYPETTRKDTCNVIVSELLSKLEIKAFENAKLYHQIEQYKSATIALNNVIKDYPNTQFKEEILFLILESNYLLATRSVESKKPERLKDTIKSYHIFVDSFPNSRKINQAENLFQTTIRELERINL
jgi:outer membrane protein assembly factor BamD